MWSIGKNCIFLMSVLFVTMNSARGMSCNETQIARGCNDAPHTSCHCPFPGTPVPAEPSYPIPPQTTPDTCSYQACTTYQGWFGGKSHWYTCAMKTRRDCHAGEGCYNVTRCECGWGEECNQANN
jgi:hypothetical protein